MKKQMKASAYIRGDKTNTTGTAPVYIKVTVANPESETSFSTGKRVNPLSWSKTKQFHLSRVKEEQEIRFYCDELINKLNKTAERMKDDGKSFTAEQLANVVLGLGEDKKNKTLMSVWDEFEEDFKSQIKSGAKAADSLDKYNNVKKHLIEFLKTKHQTDCPLSDVNDQFLIFFHTYLKKTGDISKNTSNRYLVGFKTVILFAVASEYYDVTPFRKRYKLINDIMNPVFLTEQEVSAIAKKKFESERLTIVRDCYLFSCYTGFSFCDLASLTKLHIIMTGKNKVIMKSRNKTNVVETVPLIPEAQAILDKYVLNPYCISTGKLLPLNSNQKMNEYLKEIATLCNIEKKLTFHSSRHTFATTAINRGMSLDTLSILGGWSSNKQAKHYAKINNQTLFKEMKKMSGAFK